MGAWIGNGERIGPQSPRRVAVFRALALGDLLCAVPAWRALRAALPEAELNLVGLPWAADFARRFGRYFDRFIEFPGYPGLTETIDLSRLPAFLEHVRQARFDLVLQMHGSGVVSNPVAMLFGGRFTAGYYLPGEYCPDSERFLPYPEGLPEVQRHLELMRFLGLPADNATLEFPLDDHDREALWAIPESRHLEIGTYVCVHPGAARQTGRWLPDRFAAVADALASEGRQIVLTGSAAERPLAEGIAAQMQQPAINFAGRTSLGALGALLEASALLIANDTGVTHIAAALGVPRVVVVTSSDPARWQPSDGDDHRVLSHPVACRPCAYADCPIAFPCATGLDAEPVISAARELLLQDLSRPARPLSPAVLPSEAIVLAAGATH